MKKVVKCLLHSRCSVHDRYSSTGYILGFSTVCLTIAFSATKNVIPKSTKYYGHANK